MKRPLALVLFSLVTAACVAPTNTDAASSQPADDDAALAAWFAEEICPNGVAVERMDTRTGERRVVPCEEVRPKLVADDDARAVLLDLYQQSLQPRPDGEPVAEAQQRWSPVGFACSFLMASAALAFNPPGAKFGCNDPKANNPDACAKATTWGLGGLGMLCCFI